MALATPALFLIREKPPSPPTIVGIKKRPVQTFKEAFKDLYWNPNYILIFLFFNCVNTVSIYGSEIQPFTDEYDYKLFDQSLASILFCVFSILGSLVIGRILDLKQWFKKMQIFIACALAACLLATLFLLQFEPNFDSIQPLEEAEKQRKLYKYGVIAVIVLTGVPIGATSVVSY